MSVPDLVSTGDAVLIARVAAGDPAALGRLYDRYARVLFGVTYRMLGDPEAAEEVVQDAFHAVWRRGGSYRAERGSVRTWLLTITRNAAIDRLRARARLERETALDEAREVAAAGAPEERAIASLDGAEVRSALLDLPAEQRQAIALAFWGGLSQSEIAARTGAPLGTVKSRVRLGMNKLRERLLDGS